MKHHPLTPYMFLLPAMILLSAFVFYPALEAFRLSFTDYNIINPPQYVGTENYEKLWKDGTFWLTLRNTFLYLFVVVPALVVLPLILAIVVNRKLKGMVGSEPPIMFRWSHRWSLPGWLGNGCLRKKGC